MHLKNWSLIYPNKISARLAPAYDFVSTIAFLNDDEMALKFLKTKKMSDLSFELLSHFSKKMDLPENLVINEAKETVEKFKTIWPKEQKHLPLPLGTIDKINMHLHILPLYQVK